MISPATPICELPLEMVFLWTSLAFIVIVILVTRPRPMSESKKKQWLNKDDPRIQYACMCMAAISKICAELDLAGYCVIVQGPKMETFYDMEITKGEIFAAENYCWLKKILTETDDSIKCDFLRNQFGLSEEEAKSIDVINLKFFYYDNEEKIDFSDNRLIDLLPVVGSAYHINAFGKVLRERVPKVVIEVARHAIVIKFGCTGRS